MMWKKYLKKKLLCPIEEGRELSSMTTFNVGGAAELFIEPLQLRDMVELFTARADFGFPVYVLAGGTNIVFSDGELSGAVVSTKRLNASYCSERDGHVFMDMQAGFLLPLLVSETVKNALGGAEFAFGIPGTVGGALAGNAGAGGRSVGELLEEVTTVEPDGSVRTWKRGEFDFAYRYFSLTAPNRAIVSCKMKFPRVSYRGGARELERFKLARAAQPHGARSAGCVFKNPSGDSAGRLLDSCGCKGLKIGGAFVSDAHANFIINSGDATGADVFMLMSACRDIVIQKTGVFLETEIKFLGCF